jgi:hypothetical protein
MFAVPEKVEVGADAACRLEGFADIEPAVRAVAEGIDSWAVRQSFRDRSVAPPDRRYLN